MRGLALAALLLSARALGQGYERTTVKGQPERPLVWLSRSLEFRAGAQGSAATPGRSEEQAIEAAFITWQRAAFACGNGWEFFPGRPVPVADYHLGPSEAVLPQLQVLFRDVSCDDVVPADDECRKDPDTAHTRCANAYQCMWGDPFTIGLTTVTHRTLTGEILDADIELNAAPSFGQSLPAKRFTAVDGPACPQSTVSAKAPCVAYDIENTMTHEIGHALGFDHVRDPASTMYADAAFGETSKRVLDDGTRTGFCTVYGPPLEAATGDTGCSAAPVTPGLLGAAWLLGRRRARRR